MRPMARRRPAARAGRDRSDATTSPAVLAAGDDALAGLRVGPGEGAELDACDPRATVDFESKEWAKARLVEEVERIASLQELLWAEGRRALLVVLQALDAGGKDGTTRAVFSGVNPQGCSVV